MGASVWRLGLKRFIEIRYELDSLVVDTMTIHLPCWFGCFSMLASSCHSRQAHGWFQLNSPWKTEKEVKLLVSNAFTYTILISHPCALRRNAGTKEKAFLWRPAKPSDHHERPRHGSLFLAKLTYIFEVYMNCLSLIRKHYNFV